MAGTGVAGVVGARLSSSVMASAQLDIRRCPYNPAAHASGDYITSARGQWTDDDVNTIPGLVHGMLDGHGLTEHDTEGDKQPSANSCLEADDQDVKKH